MADDNDATGVAKGLGEVHDWQVIRLAIYNAYRDAPSRLTTCLGVGARLGRQLSNRGQRGLRSMPFRHLPELSADSHGPQRAETRRVLGSRAI